MSTLPGRTGVIALSLSFAATFGIVLAVAGTASDLMVMPPPAAPAPFDPPGPPTVFPMENPGAPGATTNTSWLESRLRVDGTGVHHGDERIGTADEVIADPGRVTRRLADHARSVELDLSTRFDAMVLRVAADGSPAAALAAAAGALDAGHELVTVIHDGPGAPYLACEITVAPTDAAIAAAKMSGSLATACAAATEAASPPDAL
jgi:hypothetical protein